MRRVIVGILSLVCASTAQAQTWNGKLYRIKQEFGGVNYRVVNVRRFTPRRTPGWSCSRSSTAGGWNCTRIRSINDDVQLEDLLMLRRNDDSAAQITSLYRGVEIGKSVYWGRLRYSRR